MRRGFNRNKNIQDAHVYTPLNGEFTCLLKLTLNRETQLIPTVESIAIIILYLQFN